MWYKYVIPRHSNLAGMKGWRWFNLIIYPVSSHSLNWKHEGNGNYFADVPFSEGVYHIGPSEHGGYSCVGNGMKFTYRRTMDEAAATCNRHFLMKAKS